MSFTQRFLGHQPNKDTIEKALHAYHAIIDDKRAGLLPVLDLPENPHLIAAFDEVSTYFREKFKTVIVLGTGGSSLGGQALCAIAQDAFGFQNRGPRIIFLDNVDPDTFTRLFQWIDFKTTGFIVISKSGNTAETTCQMLAILEAWDRSQSNPAEHFLCITEEKQSTLTGLAETYQLQTLPHNPHIGGRFAALSLVGLLPAMIAGLNPINILKGANGVLKDGTDSTSITGSAWTFEQSTQHKSLSVMMPYCDRLQLFCKWYRQLWAESLGKDGKGITPIAAFGTVDQHSQLQLYLDGPKDKMFTLIATPHKGKGDPIQDPNTELTGHTMGDLMQAEQDATIQTLSNRECPVRVFEVQEINEESIGALMMHFMLETMITARLMNVNAFDQPAVEDGKILAMKYLKKDLAA